MGLLDHAQRELRAAGLYDVGSDYDGMLGHAVEELIALFAKQGHSGFSAHQTLKIFSLLGNFKSLGPLTANPDEWMDVSEMSGRTMFQNRRMCSCFSTDGGRTFYDIDERQSWWRRMLPHHTPLRWRLRHHRSAVCAEVLSK